MLWQIMNNYNLAQCLMMCDFEGIPIQNAAAQEGISGLGDLCPEL